MKSTKIRAQNVTIFCNIQGSNVKSEPYSPVLATPKYFIKFERCVHPVINRCPNTTKELFLTDIIDTKH